MNLRKILSVISIGIFCLTITHISLARNIQEGFPPDLYPIRASITSEPIDLVAMIDPMAFHRMAPGMIVFSDQEQGHPRCTIENQGWAIIDFTVQAEIQCWSGPPWMMGSSLGAVGHDTCVVAAIFTQPLTTRDDSIGDYSRDLCLDDFSDNDVIGSIPLVASTDVLARDNSKPDPDDGDYVKGYNVLPQPNYAIRSLRFLFQAPTSWSYAPNDQQLLVTIGAVAH